jgi:hypothetical protein
MIARRKVITSLPSLIIAGKRAVRTAPPQLSFARAGAHSPRDIRESLHIDLAEIHHVGPKPFSHVDRDDALELGPGTKGGTTGEDFSCFHVFAIETLSLDLKRRG